MEGVGGGDDAGLQTGHGPAPLARKGQGHVRAAEVDAIYEVASQDLLLEAAWVCGHQGLVSASTVEPQDLGGLVDHLDYTALEVESGIAQPLPQSCDHVEYVGALAHGPGLGPHALDRALGGQLPILLLQTLEVAEASVTERNHVGEAGERFDLLLGEGAGPGVGLAAVHGQRAEVEGHVDHPSGCLWIVRALAAPAAPRLSPPPVLQQGADSLGRLLGGRLLSPLVRSLRLGAHGGGPGSTQRGAALVDDVDADLVGADSEAAELLAQHHHDMVDVVGAGHGHHLAADTVAGPRAVHLPVLLLEALEVEEAQVPQLNPGRELGDEPGIVGVVLALPVPNLPEADGDVGHGPVAKQDTHELEGVLLGHPVPGSGCSVLLHGGQQVLLIVVTLEGAGHLGAPGLDPFRGEILKGSGGLGEGQDVSLGHDIRLGEGLRALQPHRFRVVGCVILRDGAGLLIYKDYGAGRGLDAELQHPLVHHGHDSAHVVG